MRGLRFVIGLMALTGSAAASDLPVKAPPPPAATAYDWTGAYVGGHGAARKRHDPQEPQGPYDKA